MDTHVTENETVESADETETETETETESVAETEAEKTRATVPISIPIDFMTILKNAAEAEGVTVAALARQRLAYSFGYTLPPMTRNRAKTYATEEERKEAQKVKAKERYTTANALLAAIKAGELNVDLAALVAKYAATKQTEAAPSA